MNHLRLLLPLTLLGLFVACQRAENKSAPASPAAQKAPAPSPSAEDGANRGAAKGVEADIVSAQSTTPLPKEIFSSAAATVGAIDSIKTFVRTAEMRFRTPEVLKATLQIEDIAKRNGGFVVSNDLATEVEARNQKPFGRDSALEMTRFHLTCHLVLRVPYRQLDTTLRSIGRLADWLDYRRVTAQDIGLDLLEKELAKARQRDYQGQVASAASGAKPSTRLEAADRTLGSREAMDESRLQTLRLQDQVRFSTVTLDLYGLSQYREVLVADKDLYAEQRGFFVRLAHAFRQGAKILESLLLGLIHLWAILALAGLLFWGYKRVKKAKS